MSAREYIVEVMVAGFGVGLLAGWTWRHVPELSPAGGTLPLLAWLGLAVVAFVSTVRGNR